jgi:hypothetical protein
VKPANGPTCPWDRRVDPADHLCACGRPAPRQWTCEGCLDDLRDLLASLAELEEQLTVALTRAHAASYSGSTHTTGEAPLPYNDRAARSQRRLVIGLMTAARRCNPDDMPRVPTITALAHTIATQLNALADQPYTTSMLRDLTARARAARTVALWQPRQRMFIGICEGTEPTDTQPSRPCSGKVYAEQDADAGLCDKCGRPYLTWKKRSAMEAELDARLYSAAEIARLSTYLGLDMSRERIRKWINQRHARRLLVARGHDPQSGDPLFRYGEVRALLEQATT